MCNSPVGLGANLNINYNSNLFVIGNLLSFAKDIFVNFGPKAL